MLNRLWSVAALGAALGATACVTVPEPEPPTGEVCAIVGAVLDWRATTRPASGLRVTPYTVDDLQRPGIGYVTAPLDLRRCPGLRDRPPGGGVWSRWVPGWSNPDDAFTRPVVEGDDATIRFGGRLFGDDYVLRREADSAWRVVSEDSWIIITGS